MCYKLRNTNYEVSDSTYEIKALTFAFKIGLLYFIFVLFFEVKKKTEKAEIFEKSMNYSTIATT